MLKKTLLVLQFLLLSLTNFAQNDSSCVRWHQTVAFRTFTVPAILIGYGLSVRGNNGLFYSSKDAHRDIQRQFPGFRTYVDDYMQYSPALAVYGLNLCGVKGKNKLFDYTMIYVLSMGLNTGIVQGLKHTVREPRPDGSGFHSFPSGHTAKAFVAAEFLRQEYKHRSFWYGALGYSVATATGMLRMLNNRHWMADVFVGAGIGILSTKIIYVTYPWVKRKIVKRNKNRGNM